MMKLKIPLRPFQKEGVDFLVSKKYAMLCDEMGLGKTVQSIVAALKIKEKEGISRCLVITPNSLKYNFAEEIEKFTYASFTVIDGSKKKREKLWKNDTFFTITNYANLLTDSFEKFIKNQHWDIVILDEASFIKNMKAIRTKRVKIIPRTRRWALTGTPIETTPLDLFSIIEFLHPLYFKGNFYSFRYKYCILKKLKLKKRTVNIVVGTKNLDMLSVKIDPIYLRRTKKLVAPDLPDKTYKNIVVPLSKPQKRVYQNLKKEAKKAASQDECILGYITKMRLVCDGTACYGKNHSSKLDALQDLVEDGLTNCVVFTNWLTPLKQITAMLDDMKKSYAVISGEISPKDRKEHVKRFKNNEIEFIIGDSAMEYGVNLQSADSLLLFDYPWSWSRLNQRIDRVHRIGQKSNVLIITLITKDTIEERVIDIMRKEQDMFSIVMNEDKEDFLRKVI